MFVFGVLIELGKDLTDVVHEKLGQFFVGLQHETKELAMVVVYYVLEFLFKREWLQVPPGHLPFFSF